MQLYTILMLLIALAIEITFADKVCPDRKVHFSAGGKDFHFSWREFPGKEFTWSQGRKYCQNHCMDLVSLEMKSDWDTVIDIFNNGKYCADRNSDLLPQGRDVIMDDPLPHLD